MTSLLKKKPLDSPDKLTHDWYSNDSWPIYHRQLTNIPPTVHRYTTDSWLIYHRQLTDSKSRCVVEISTDTRPIVYLTIDRLSTDYPQTIHRLSTDYRPSIDQLSTAISTAMSTAMSTDISVDITHSKQDKGVDSTPYEFLAYLILL